jgi:predicted nucleotidyltransferase component of viral defense system
MIPMMNIVAWGRVVPWVDLRQVEQDLIISRAIVDLFSDPFLHGELRFRGGTALHKLHFPVPMRYSEDIDLVRTTSGPVGPILARAREVLEPWLGHAAFERSPVAPKLLFKVPAEDTGIASAIRLKVEINTREIDAYDPTLEVEFRVDNPWFSARASVCTSSREEMLATKLRALLQRNKGRDLYDLAHALKVFEGLSGRRVVECLALDLQKAGVRISRAEAEERMFAKLRKPGLLMDLRPLLSTVEGEGLTEQTAKDTFAKVFSELIVLLPGDPWAKTQVMKKRFGIEGP